MKSKNIIAIGAHPDDIEFSCPITLRKYISQGYNIFYVIATNGENGFKIKSLSRDERIKIRKEEQYAAAKLVGVKKVFFLNRKDGFLEYDDSLRKDITMIIKEVKPEIIFSFDPANLTFDNINLQHRDHRILATAVFDSVFAAKNQFIYSGGFKTHKVDLLMFFGSNKPNTHIDITCDIEFKMEILKCFKSQFPNFENFKKFFLKNIAAKDESGKDYYERFRTVIVNQISY